MDSMKFARLLMADEDGHVRRVPDHEEVHSACPDTLDSVRRARLKADQREIERLRRQNKKLVELVENLLQYSKDLHQKKLNQHKLEQKAQDAIKKLGPLEDKVAELEDEYVSWKKRAHAAENQLEQTRGDIESLLKENRELQKKLKQKPPEPKKAPNENQNRQPAGPEKKQEPEAVIVNSPLLEELRNEIQSLEASPRKNDFGLLSGQTDNLAEKLDETLTTNALLREELEHLRQEKAEGETVESQVLSLQARIRELENENRIILKREEKKEAKLIEAVEKIREMTDRQVSFDEVDGLPPG